MRKVSAGGLARVVTYFALVIALTLLCVGDGRTEGGMQGVAAQTLERPNIVFVLTDDQFPGSEEHMPNLNAEIVREGVEFENMTSTTPRSTATRPPPAAGRSSGTGGCIRAP